MRHAFTVTTPAGKVCSVCGVAQTQNDLVPRCESMPHWGRHWWEPGDGAEVLRAELVGADDVRAARALPVTAPAPRQLRRALRAGDRP